MRSKLFLLSAFLFVLLCSSLAPLVGASTVWSRTYGGSGTDCAHSLVAMPDGGYALAGAWNYSGDCDFWLVKTDEFGFSSEVSWLPSLILLLTGTSLVAASSLLILIKRRKLRKRSLEEADV